MTMTMTMSNIIHISIYILLRRKIFKASFPDLEVLWLTAVRFAFTFSGTSPAVAAESSGFVMTISIGPSHHVRC